MTNVVKRNGETAPLDLERVHHIVEHACRGLAGVSESQVEINSGLQFFDGIESEQIQNILIKSASDLISLDNPSKAKNSHWTGINTSPLAVKELIVSKPNVGGVSIKIYS